MRYFMSERCDLEKVKNAIAKGNITFSPRVQESLGRMDLQNPDFTIREIGVEFWGKFEKDGYGNNGGMNIDYDTVSAGCGRIEFHIDKNGKLHLYSQGMGKKFCMSVLEKLFDEAEHVPD